LIVKNSHFATMEFSRCARDSSSPHEKNRAGCFFNSRGAVSQNSAARSIVRRGRR